VSKNEKLNGATNRKIKVKQGSRKTVNTSDSRLYHKVTTSSRERCNIGGL